VSHWTGVSVKQAWWWRPTDVPLDVVAIYTTGPLEPRARVAPAITMEHVTATRTALRGF
jgi:hypothetical protein